MNTANIIFLNKNNRKVKIIIVIKNSLRADVSYFLFVACGKETNLRFYSEFLWVLYECFTAFVERSEYATKAYV